MDLKKVTIIVCMSLSLSTTGCSLANYVSQEGLTGALGGTAVGSAVGWFIGEEVGNKEENIALNAAIGTGVGILAGAAVNQKNIRSARKKEVAIREAKLISKNQKELDKLREEINESSSWGRNEVKPWDKRYIANEQDPPYQGNPNYHTTN